MAASDSESCQTSEKELSSEYTSGSELSNHQFCVEHNSKKFKGQRSDNMDISFTSLMVSLNKI